MFDNVFTKRGISLFYKYFFSNVVVFFVPLVVLGTVAFYTSVNQLNQEIMLNYENKLEQVVNDMDRQFDNLASVALEIANNRLFLPYNLNKSPYHSIEAVQALKKYKNGLYLPQYALLYYKGEQQIYSFDGKYETGIFFEKEIILPDWPLFLEEINHSVVPFYKNQKSMYFRNAGMSEAFIYVYPVSTNQSMLKDAALVYFVTSQAIEQRIHNVLGAFEGNFYVFGPSQERIASVKKDDIELQSPILPLHTGGVQPDVLRQDGSGHNVFQLTSDHSRHTYVLVVPNASLLNEADRLAHLMIAILVISLLGGLLFAWFFAYRHFSPIKNMRDYIKKALPSAPVLEQHRNELTIIGRALADTLHSNDILKVKVDGQHMFIQQNVLQSLLRGNWEEDAGEPLQETLGLKGPVYCVMIVSHSGSGEFPAFKESLINVLEKRYSGNDTAHTVDMIHEKHVAVLYSQADKSLEPMKERANELLNECSAQGMELKIGIGNMYGSLTEVKFSYIEALSALEHQKAANPVVAFKEMTRNYSAFLWYPTEELLRLQQSVKLGDAELSGEMLRQLSDAIKQQQLSFLMEKLVSFEVLNALLRTVYELNLQVPHQYLEIVGTVKNTETLFMQIGELIHEVCGHVRAHRERNQKQLTRDIFRYIEEHYLEYDFSLEKLADKFDLSLYALGKFFKDETGIGFKDYLIRLKMEAAKTLLGNSDKTVNEITSDIGYSNVSHFIKTFKKIEGMTPAQFRQMLRP